MTTDLQTTEKKQSRNLPEHLWKKGQSGNPNGRKKGVPNKMRGELLEQLMAAGPEVLAATIKDAIDHDGLSRKLVVERLIPLTTIHQLGNEDGETLKITFEWPR